MPGPFPLIIEQTIQAGPGVEYPGPFPCNAGQGQLLAVPEVAKSGAIVALIVDLTKAMPLEVIAVARSAIYGASGYDQFPITKLLGSPAILPGGKKVQQNLVDLQPNALYEIMSTVRTAAGREMSFISPIVAAPAPYGNFLLWDGPIPWIMTDDHGVPIRIDDTTWAQRRGY